MSQMTSPTLLPPDPGTRALSFPGPADKARSAAAYAAIASPSVGETAWAAFEGTIPALIGNQVSRQGFMPDPTHQLDDKIWKSLTDGIDPDLWSKYQYTVSRDHANSLLVENRLEMERRRTLANAGMGGTAANIVAGITDPAMFLATVGTAGLAGGMRLATTAGRIGSLIESGATAGVPMVALETYRASQDPSVRTSDIVSAGLGGFGLGVAAKATVNAGRGIRFSAGGLAQAGPAALVDSAMADDEHRNAWSGLAINFVLGGAGNALHSARNPAQRAMADDLEKAGRTAAKDFQVAEAHAAAQATGVEPLPSAADMAAYRNQLDQEALKARGNGTVGAIMQGHGDDAAALGMVARESKEVSATRRQFKQDMPPGFAFSSGEKQLVARLNDNGTIEVGDRFFALRPEQRLAAIKDAETGGLAAIPDEQFFVGTVADFAQKQGRISALDIAGNFPKLTFEQADAFARRLRAIDTYRAARGGQSPNAIAYEQPSGAFTPEQITQARNVAIANKGDISASKIATKLKLEYEQAKALADEVRRLDQPSAISPAAVPPVTMPIARPGDTAQTFAMPTIETVGAPGSGAVTAFGLGAASPTTIALPIAERNFLEDLDLSNLTLDPAKASKANYIQIGGTRLPLNTWGSFGMAEFLGSSESTAMRRVGKAFGYDPIPDSAGGPVLHSAPIWANERAGIKTNDDIHRFNDSYRSYAERVTGSGGKPISPEDFNSKVTYAKRRIGTEAFQNYEPEVQAAAKSWVKPVNELLELQQRHNVPASENVPHDEQYVANVWNRTAIDEWRQRDPAAMEALFERYAEGDNLQVTGLKKQNIARAFLDHAGANSHDPLAFQKIQHDPHALFERLVQQNPAFNTPEVLSQLKSQMLAPVELRLERALTELKVAQTQIDEITSIARDLDYRNNYIKAALEKRQYDPAMVDTAIEAIKNAATDNGNPVQMRRRFRGNINAETVAKDGTKLRIEDFLVNDARALANIMNRRAYGAAAFHGAMRALTPEHLPPPRTIADAMRDLQAQMKADGLSDKAIAQELRYAETLLKHTSGIPLFENTWATRAMRTMMNAQSFLRMTNARVGLQNGLEINRSMARHGMAATMQQMPALKEIWNQTKSGKLDNKLLREMRTLVGQDFDAGIRKALIDADDAGRTPQTRAERLAAKGANSAGSLSGTNKATEFAVRGTEAIIAQRLVDIARSGKAPSKARLAASGLHEWQAERLMKSIKSEIDAGTIEMEGSRLTGWNYEKWADQESVSWLRNWAALETRNLIQRGDASAYAHWMTKPVGDLLIQFRKWGVFAHRNHLLYNLNAADTQAVRETVSSFAFGALVHMVAVAEGVMLLDAASRDKYLEEKMSAEGIALGAFARSGWSAMMPAYWDAARSVAGRDPTFAYLRASGLSDGGGLLSNPTVAWLNSAANLVARTPQSLFMDDRQLSKTDVRNFTNTFIPNIFGLKRGIEALLGENLPDSASVR